MTIRSAGLRFVEWRRPYVRPSTIEAFQTQFIALDRFFGDLHLGEMTAGHLREYQRTRATNADAMWKRTAGAGTINHEINSLSQVLEYAGLWQKLKPYYQPMRIPRWTPPRVMEPEEERRLFEVAAGDPDLELAYLVASITNNTSACGCELRALQIKHVDLLSRPPEVLIPSDRVKNEFRGRRIPLNETAAAMFAKCLARAAKRGSVDREHYLFPFRVKRNTFDPTRPASRYWIRANFNKLRLAAGLPWLRPHDLRHQVITRMLECGAPEPTVMAIVGHVSRQMLDHYSHIRMEAKMSVVNAIEPRHWRVAEVRRTA
jgi:integrase